VVRPIGRNLVLTLLRPPLTDVGGLTNYRY